MKKQKGITLIALIITIIVMLILVGVTINVALNEGLFDKAKTATKKTEEQVILEEMIGLIEISDNGKISNPEEIINKMKEKYRVEYNKPNAEITGKHGTYNYIVSEEEIKIGKDDKKDDNFALIKAELEGKSFAETMNEGFSSFKNSEIILGSIEEGRISATYRDEKYIIFWIDNPEGESGAAPIAVEVKKIVEDSNNYFSACIDYSKNLEILGLVGEGEEELSVPNKIVATDGNTYVVKQLGQDAFKGKTNIKRIKFGESTTVDTIKRNAFDETGISGHLIIPEGIVTIEKFAFDSCNSITEVTIPKTVGYNGNMGGYVFDGCSNIKTVHVKGRTEEPAYIDEYSGNGWSKYWKNGIESATILWEG